MTRLLVLLLFLTFAPNVFAGVGSRASDAVESRSSEQPSEDVEHAADERPELAR